MKHRSLSFRKVSRPVFQCSYNPNSLTLSNPKTPFSKLQTPTITGGKISVFYKGLSYLKLTNKTIRVPVTREFSIYEYHFYSIPMSCCRKFDGVVFIFFKSCTIALLPNKVCCAESMTLMTENG